MCFYCCLLYSLICIRILLLGPYESIKKNLRFILAPRWLKKTFHRSPKIPWVRIAGSSLLQSIDIMQKWKEKFVLCSKERQTPEAWKNKNFSIHFYNSLKRFLSPVARSKYLVWIIVFRFLESIFYIPCSRY